MKNRKNAKKGLDKPALLVYNKLVKIRHAPIAQLDRVFGYEPKGRGFESLLACQNNRLSHNVGKAIFLLHALDSRTPKG